MNKRNVCYIWDENLIEQCDRLPAVVGRASLVHGLIHAYNLHNHMKVVRSTPATYEVLKQFHSELYLDHLKTFTEVDEDYMPTEEDEQYGIGYDCPPVSNMYELVSSVAGGSVAAARCLLLGVADVAINWCGGWHHAQRFAAEGFCYVNDIVLAIEALRRKFPRVLYIDLDVHHGNGVEDAYSISRSVFTLSLHQLEAGFYPGSGRLELAGHLRGAGYCCNLPLQAGYSDRSVEHLFGKIFPAVCEAFKPAAIVVQCGADALAGDPAGGAALTLRGYAACVQAVLEHMKPTLLLGGGGYNQPNTARLWASLTAQAGGVPLAEDIPEHAHWARYGAHYTRTVPPALARDLNTASYLDHCIATVTDNLNKYVKGKTENYYNNNINNDKKQDKPASTTCIATYKNVSCKPNDCSPSKDVYEFEE